MADAPLLLAWRNDRFTREASYSTSKISIESHRQWLKASLESENRRLYMAEVNGCAVGTVRADFENPGYELSWTVAPESRGHGIGKRMVRQLIKQLSGLIRAEIKTGNIASIRIAESSGMFFVRKVEGILHYQCNK